MFETATLRAQWIGIPPRVTLEVTGAFAEMSLRLAKNSRLILAWLEWTWVPVAVRISYKSLLAVVGERIEQKSHKWDPCPNV